MVLDASSVRTEKAVPPPSITLDGTGVTEALQGQRALSLYSGGLTIFLLGMIAMKVRKS